MRRAVGRVATLNRSPKWRNPPCGRSGPVLAARLIGRCGRAFRFRTADAFASYAGTAPVEASAADTSPRSTDNTTCNFRSGVLFADLDISISLHQIGSAAPVQRATTEFRPPTDSQDAGASCLASAHDRIFGHPQADIVRLRLSPGAWREASAGNPHLSWLA